MTIYASILASHGPGGIFGVKVEATFKTAEEANAFALAHQPQVWNDNVNGAKLTIVRNLIEIPVPE